METAITVAILNAFKDKALSAVDKISEEINQKLDNGILYYTNSIYENVSKTKTFIERDNNIPFYDIYMPLSLKYKYEEVQITNNLSELFKDSNCLTILGTAGSGKTMLMKHIFLTCCKTSERIPFLVELRKLNETEVSLEEYIYNKIIENGISEYQRIIKRWIESGDFLFIFDGFDEISIKSKIERTTQIEEFVSKYHNNYYLITSRPDADAENLHRFDNLYVINLNPSQIIEFVKKQTSVMPDGQELCPKLVEAIKEADPNIKDYFKNPLLLSMFIHTFRLHPTLPSMKKDFYDNVFDTLYTKHDSITKGGGYNHDKNSGLEKSQFIKVLEWFSYRTYIQNKYIFSEHFLYEEIEKIIQKEGLDCTAEKLIKDLTVSISIIVHEGGDYVFPHRSMQEYFAARLIYSLPEEYRIEKLYHNSKFNNHNNMNLWSLCQEMDFQVFTEEFILWNLENLRITLLKLLNTQDKTNKLFCKNVLKLMNFSADFNNDTSIRLQVENDLMEPLITYVNKRQYSFISLLLNFLSTNSISLKPFMRNVGKSQYNFSSKDIDMAIDTMYKLGLPDKFYEAYFNLCSTNLGIKNALDENRNKTSSLLDDF